MPSLDGGWPEFLTALEAGLGEATLWTAPSDIGPLPAELADRARALLDTQLDLVERLQAELATVHRHLAAVRTIPSIRMAGQSVYLDTTG